MARSGALQYYRDSLEIRRKLAQGDPGNAGWQHALAVGLGNMGTLGRVAGSKQQRREWL